MNVLQLLKGKPPAAETLRQALADAEAAASAVDAEMASLRDRRQALLLNGMDEAKLDAVEGDLNRAYRRQDRADLLITSLKERLTEAEQAEQQAEADQIVADAQAAQQDGFDAIARYGKLAAQMAETMAQLQAAERAIAAANARSSARGGRTVEGVEASYWKGKERVQQFPSPSIAGALVLPSPDQPRVFLWPRREA